jgi:leucyl aminopeptidase
MSDIFDSMLKKIKKATLQARSIKHARDCVTTPPKVMDPYEWEQYYKFVEEQRKNEDKDK